METARLFLRALTPKDDAFILSLLNSPKWIQFIGDRNCHSLEDAGNYIQKIINTSTMQYWVLENKESGNPLGVITLIKRDYLEHHDIGFALLPIHEKKGYAFEGLECLLTELKKNPLHSQLLAITKKENMASIQLLEKSGLKFVQLIQPEQEELLVYSL